jgi:trans-aconitate methyltransferase
VTGRPSDPHGWNRNTHYHDQLLASIPPGCRRALDIGCGLGTFARRLSRVSAHVDALDRERGVIERARRLSQDMPNIRFIEADFMTWAPETTYDAVSMIAAVHHLPFSTAIAKAADLLRPGGVLLVVGLDRSPNLFHYLATGAIATLITLWYRAVRRVAVVGAPIEDPQMTLREIREETSRLLPGATIRRHALLRYSLVWTKPVEMR